MKNRITILMILLLFLSACQSKPQSSSIKDVDKKLKVVTTTTMINDLVLEIGKDIVDVESIMKAGVDPHLYTAKESDTQLMMQADLVFYNGIHLEAKLADVLSSLKNTISLESGLNQSDIIQEEAGEDPHFWFDVDLWKKAALVVEKGLSDNDPKHQVEFKKNLDKYLKDLDELKDYNKKRIEEVDKEQRVLVTAHDAFNYFAKSNGFIVKSIQGISTQQEASTSKMSELANYIAQHKIKAIFTESSISPKTIEALQQAVKAKGFEVEIGAEIYSDSLKENTSYIETYKLNVDEIVKALK